MEYNKKSVRLFAYSNQNNCETNSGKSVAAVGQLLNQKKRKTKLKQTENTI